MVKANVIRMRLRKVDEYLAILEKLRRYSYDEFVSDPEHYGSAERFLHLTIEAFTDMGNHIVADDELGYVASYRDIPAILAEQGLIEPELRETWIAMIGFRNVLVHDYINVDQ